MATVGLTEAEREAIERLEKEVIHPSMTALVILDFWSDRSAVSKQLSLALETVVAEYAAKGVVLAKVDVDKDKAIAAQFRIQSIPTVYAIYRGQPVAELTDFRTEAQLKRALDQLLGQLKIGAEGAAAEAEIAPLVAMAEQVLADGDPPRAVSIFRQIRDMAPDNPVVIGGLVRALVGGGRDRRSARDRRRPVPRAGEKAGNQPGQGRARARLGAAGGHRRARSPARGESGRP